MSVREKIVTVATLETFAEAWNRHDIESLMAFMADDCVFETSEGPHTFGTRHEGRDQVRAAFPRIWETYRDARWEEARHFVCGDRGCSEWVFRGTRADGVPVEVWGVDVFEFRDGKIKRKNTFRKNRSLP